MTHFSLSDLEAIVAARAEVSPDQSWTAKTAGAGAGTRREEIR